MYDESQNNFETISVSRKRLLIGASIFIIGHVIGPLSIPIIATSKLAYAIKAPLSGFLLVGFPQISTLFAVIFLGKPGFAWLKYKLFRFLKKFTHQTKISRTRHRIGLGIIILVLVSNTLEPYISSLFPSFFYNRLNFAIMGDIILIIGVLILGGDFWDKLHALFIYESDKPHEKKQPL